MAGSLVIFALVLGVHDKRPSGVQDPRNEVVEIRRVEQANSSWSTFPYQSYRAIREESTTLADVAASIGPFAPLVIRTGDQLEGARVGLATSGHMRVLGVRPVAGRGFAVDDERVGAAPVCLLSQRLANRLGLVGRNPGATVIANERTIEVVGVLPDAFRGHHDSKDIEVWLPISQYSILAPRNPEYQPLTVGTWWQFSLVGRLEPGVTRNAAEAEITAIQRRVVQDSYPEMEARAERVVVEPLRAFAHHERQRFHGTALLLGLPAALVLGMTVLNVATLETALALRRQREVAIRLSIGATPWRIIRERLGEGLTLAPFSAGVGVLATLAILDLLASLSHPRFLPLVESATLQNAWTPAFVLGVSLGTALTSSILPAWSAGRTPPLLVLQGGDWTQRRSLGTRRNLLIGQTALVTLLTVVSGASARSLWTARNSSPGFATRGLTVARIDPVTMGYDKAEALAFARRVVDSLNATSPVPVAALSRLDPIRPVVRAPMAIVDPAGGPDRPVGTVTHDEVSHNYFEVLEIPVALGRSFRRTGEKPGAPEVVVNATAARRWPWPDGRVLGSRLRLGNDVPYIVVGVSSDVRSQGILAPPAPFAYLPLFQRTEQNVFDLYGYAVYLRRSAGLDSAVHPVAATVRALDPTMPVQAARTIDDLITETLPLETMLEGLASSAAALALVIVALGLYASASQVSAERTGSSGCDSHWARARVRSGGRSYAGAGRHSASALPWGCSLVRQ